MFQVPKNLLNPEKINLIMASLNTQFFNRAVIEQRNQGKDYGLSFESIIKENVLWFNVKRKENTYSIHIPLPFVENGITFVEQNNVRRAVCDYCICSIAHCLFNEVNYLDLINSLIFDHVPDGILPNKMTNSKSTFIQRIAYSFENDTTSVVMYQLQKAINEIINHMPIHETMMNSWAMNQRVVLIDMEFQSINDPEIKLKYQVEKSKVLFTHKRWTQIGLSDGVLADKNYSLKVDLRRTIPFGRRMHNPARNLYSTLGMRGDEMPLIRSESCQKLIDSGISRTGWNLFTMFVDVPGVWEDQIVVNAKHADKKVQYHRRYQCFGSLRVKEGELIKHNQIICLSADGEPSYCDVVADRIWVDSIVDTEVLVGSDTMVAHNIVVNFERRFKDGTKITNCAANKGVIRLVENLGVAIDPRNGDTKEIDVIVSSTAVHKRKNYTQVLEALANNVNGDKIVVYPDDIEIGMALVEEKLESCGFPKTGEWMCNTAFGDLMGVCGKVFWGVTHDPEDMLWDKNETVRRNGRDIRVAGLKFSHVEFRALTTRFGKNNPILDEIMSYVQGGEDVNEMINMLESKRGNLPTGKPVVSVQNILPVNQSGNVMTNLADMVGTVADENLLPEGFILQLPVSYQVVIGKDLSSKKEYVTIIEGWPFEVEDSPEIISKHRVDKIYVPYANLRRPWRHQSGKYGLTDITAMLNKIIAISHRLMGCTEEVDQNGQQEKFAHQKMLYTAIGAYFRTIADKLGAKSGEISTHGMSIRYPFSAKAVATLSNSLPKNVVQIHRNMATALNVREGDVVLVERFPCMGFMSVRPQKVTITDDERCRFTIRVSNESLGSLSLDFDGDVIYIASFHTLESKELLLKEWTNPNRSCYGAIQQLNGKMGKPHFKTHSLQDYGISAFAPLTVDSHAEIIEKLTGVKSHTGLVIAFAYNIMRIIESSEVRNDTKTQVAVEVFLDKVGNSVFKQKHGVKSLHSKVIDAICCGDVEALVCEGFERGTSTIICDTIRKKALELGVGDLKGYHKFIKENGASNIVNRIVRTKNKIYFASRSKLEACELLHHLESNAVDIPSKMLKLVLSGQIGRETTQLDKMFTDKAMSCMGNEMKGACTTILEKLELLFTPVVKKETLRESNKTAVDW